MLDALYTCGTAQVRNPRTDRCVRLDGALGRGLHAAAKALRAGAEIKKCHKGAFDPSVGRCIADTNRAAALRELLARYALASGSSNRNAAALSSMVTSQALAKAAAADARAERNEAGSMFQQLAGYSTDLQRQLAEAQSRALNLQQRLANAERQRNQARRDLGAVRALLRQATNAATNAA